MLEHTAKLDRVIARDMSGLTLSAGQLAAALDRIDRTLAPGGRLVIGVPMELWAPALAKGVFRAARRPGELLDGQGHL